MEDAVRASNQPTTNGKHITKGKKPNNPFLANQLDETEPDDCDCLPEVSEHFKRDRVKLMEIWSCKQHPQQVCLASALYRHHKTIGFEGLMAWLLAIVRALVHPCIFTDNYLQDKKVPGVNLYNPPKIPAFDFFHKLRDHPNTTTTTSRRNGVRFHSEQPMEQLMNIILPAEAFQLPRKRTYSSSSTHDSLSSYVELQSGSNAAEDIPTLRMWLEDLQRDDGITYAWWDFLHKQFEDKESLDLKISCFMQLSANELKSGYKLKMEDAIFFQDQLKKASLQFGFGKDTRKAFQKKRKT